MSLISISFDCPRPEDKAFAKYWEMFVEDVQHRENIKRSHLIQLEVLCDLMLEYEILQKEIRIHGRVYYSVGRNGDQCKLRPEVTQLNRVCGEIRNYSRMLGLVLVKDTTTTEKEDENEFDD